jgi:adenine phosphoribosyltransferase
MAKAQIEIARDQALAARVEKAIRIVTGFPRPGVRFRDISPIIESDPPLFRAAIDAIAGFHRASPPDCIVGIESWGFVFAAPVAYVLGSRLCLARRPDRLPRDTISATYDMCYAEGRGLALQRDAVRAGDRVVVIDDIIASGGSALAAASLAEQAGGRCIGVACLAAFVDWGAQRIAEKGIPVHAIGRL